MRKLLGIGFVALAGFLSLSANKEEKAQAEDVAAKFLLTQRKTLFTDLGRVGLHCGEYEVVPGMKNELTIDPNVRIDMLVLKNAGFTSVAPDGANYWKVSWTTKGQAFIDSQKIKGGNREQETGCDYQTFDLPLAIPTLVDITNTKPGEREFKWKFVPTELGLSLQQKGNAYVQLSDNDKQQLKDHFATLPIPIPPDLENDIHTEKPDLQQHK